MYIYIYMYIYTCKKELPSLRRRRPAAHPADVREAEEGRDQGSSPSLECHKTPLGHVGFVWGCKFRVILLKEAEEGREQGSCPSTV